MLGKKFKQDAMTQNYTGDWIKTIDQGRPFWKSDSLAENWEIPRSHAKQRGLGEKLQGKRTPSVKMLGKESVLMPRQYCQHKSWDKRLAHNHVSAWMRWSQTPPRLTEAVTPTCSAPPGDTQRGFLPSNFVEQLSFIRTPEALTIND